MNERMTALIVQAHQSSSDNREMVYNLCELVVRECAKWLKETDSNEDIGEDDAKGLLRHFGVSDD